MTTAATKRQTEAGSSHRFFEDAEFSKTVLVAVTAIGSALLLCAALFANFALK